MHYDVSSSTADPRDQQLCKMFPAKPLLCGGGCGGPLPALHIHLWFDDADYATGVCSEACAAQAIQRRSSRDRRLTA